MIKEIILDGVVIRYQITYKNNKNTYFYFKRNGYIQINASKKQKPEKILNFIEENKTSFIKKYQISNSITHNKKSFYYFGIEYKKIKDNSLKNIKISHDEMVLYEPNIADEDIEKAYKVFNKSIILRELDILKEKYQDNSFIDISNIKIKTRYMNTRFGSCNPLLKSININLNLIHYDIKYLEYVFLHEIAHLKYQNHSKDYYNLLKKISPNYQKLRKELNNKFIQR